MSTQTKDQYFENLFKFSNVPIIIWDKDLKITRFNSAFEKLSGRTEESIIGKSIDILFPESSAKDSIQRIKNAETTNHLKDTEIEIIHKNGFINTVIWNSAPILADDGQTVISTIAQGRDMSECKRKNEELAHLNQQKDLILSSVAEGILGLDLQGNHTFVNPVAAKMLGYDQEELIGLHSHSIWHHTKIDGSNYPSSECPIYAAYTDGTIHYSSNEVFWRKDGTSFFVEYSSTPIFDKGKLTGAVVAFTDISERKKTEEELNKSEQRMNAFVNDSLLCIYFVNVKTKNIVYANPSFSEMLGYTKDEIESLKIYDFIDHPEESIDNFLNHVIETKKRNIGVRKWKTKAGKIIDMLVNAVHGDQHNDEIIYISGQDITERTKTENAVIRSEKLLKHGESIAKIGHWKIVIDEQIVYASEGAKNIYGTNKELLTSEDVKHFVIPEYRERNDAALKVLITEGKPYDIEFKIIRENDGKIVEIHSKAEYDSKSNTVFGVIQDITERKKSEQELKDSENKFKSVLQSAKDSIILANKKGEIIFWNQHAEKTFGYKEIEVIGKPLSFIMPERYRTDHQNSFEKHVSSSQDDMNDDTVEMHGLKKNGKEFSIELSLSHWVNGDEKFYCGIIRDITERKNAEEEQLSHIKKLSEIAYLQSHQVRAPIASILGLINLIDFENPTTDQNIEVINNLKKTSTMCDLVIKKIVDKTSEIDELNKKF